MRLGRTGTQSNARCPTPPPHPHPTPPQCRGPEYQAEVGLLSRYILVQGDASAERTRRGPHIRVEGAARVRGVQAYRAGQARGEG